MVVKPNAIVDYSFMKKMAYFNTVLLISQIIINFNIFNLGVFIYRGLIGTMGKRKRTVEGQAPKDGDRFKCGHCHTYLSKSQYHDHKRRFRDARSGEWQTLQDLAKVELSGSSSSEGIYKA